MKSKTTLHRMFVLLITLMSAISANAAEAYACYTPGNATLTFYYDNQRSTRSNTYNLNTGSNEPDWYTDGTKSNVTKAVFDPSFVGARPTSTYFWFMGMRSLQSIEGLNYLNTSEVINMAWMFAKCTKLKSLDLSSFNTSKVTRMYDMFYDCDNLQTIYVGNGWTTALVTGYNSVSLFYGCSNLVGGKGTAYNDSNPTDTSYAHIDGGPNNPGYFTEEGTEAYACYTSSNTTLTFYFDKLRSSRSGKTYDALNTDRTENVAGWLSDYTYRDVTNVVFDPSFANARPRSTCDWFYNMDNLESIEGMNYLNTSMVTSMGSMFEGCVRLTRLDLSSFNTSKVTNMSYMFASCKSLTTLDLSSFSTSGVRGMDRMFINCTNLQTIYVGSGWSTEAVPFSIYMFDDCTSLVGCNGTTYNADHVDADYAHIDGGSSDPGYFSEPPEAYACYTESNTTLTFYYDKQRSTRPGTTYNLNRVGDLASWINDGNNAYVTKVVFDPLFADARPTSTYGWFYNMENLQTIDGLIYLNTSKVTDMTYMFGYCKKLTSLDLSSFNTFKVSDMGYMFYSCLNLQTIIVGNSWSTAAVTSSSNMFMGCRVLVGGKGTNYDVNHVNRTYARVDGGTGTPGYFTAANEAYACYTPSNKTLTFYFDNQRDSREGTTYDLNTGFNRPGWNTDGTIYDVTKVVFNPSFANARPTSTSYWFSSMRKLESITDLSCLNTSEVTNMVGMFNSCVKLTNLDLSAFNASKVTRMYSMFYGCTNLQTIYVGDGWSTAVTTESRYMFSNCTNLVGGQGTTYNADHVDADYAHIDGGSSDPGYFTEPPEAYACYTESNTTLTFYFDKQRSSRPGTTYDLNMGGTSPVWLTNGTYDNVTKVVFDSSFAGARPTTTFAWLYGMTKLQSIEGIRHLNTSKVTNMSFMFYYCSSLKSLDLSNFNTSVVTEMEYMFGNCSDLHTIYVGDGWNMAKVTQSTNMFSNCTSLKGCKGTTYNDSNPKDKTYAHIDGGSSDPGYFRDINTGIATDLHQVTSDKQQVQSDEWYTIDGRKLNGMPAKKGVYIYNGRAVVL